MRKQRTSDEITKKGTEPEIVGLRIIGGSLRGRKLEYSGEIRTRPMKDRVREAVFNLLGTSVIGARVIDLFAGTGAMAIESISRKAASAICIERHYPTVKLIERGAEELGIARQMSAVFGDAFLWTKSFVLPDPTPLIVFCCPPYDFYVDRNAEMLALIERWVSLCPPRSMVVVEADERFDFASLPHAEDWDIRPYPPAFIGIWEHVPQQQLAHEA
jgi:16S rRNA (guanine966-N2)-methyltransferase